MNFQNDITGGTNLEGLIQAVLDNKMPTAVASKVNKKSPVDTLFPEGGVVGDASFLESHFGIVPGVLTGAWMMENRGALPIHAFTRRYDLAITPGMEVTKGADNGTIKVLGGKPGESKKILAQMEYNVDKTEYIDHTIPDDMDAIAVHEGANWIPHGDKFRFCDNVGHQGDILTGRYTVKNTYITEDGTIPFWQIEEACAQMMLGAYRTKKGEDAPYGTYAEARTKGSKDFDTQMAQLKPGDTINCIGEAKDIIDERGRVKQINFIYTCFANGVPLFQGNIIGNAIAKKIWERQFGNR